MPFHPASTPPLDPAPKASPKRKRSTSTSIIAADSLFAPDINIRSVPPAREELPETQAGMQVQGVETILPGTGSPRTRSPRTNVANKFQNLALRGHPLPAVRFGAEGDADGGGKRVKFGEEEPEKAWATTPANPQMKRLPYPSASSTLPRPDFDVEVLETPQSSQQAESPPPSHGKINSPPPPANTTISKIDLAALTWQDSEITGHLALDPDDDGYGINGIGFKPTAQQMYARTQRRRQQVLEWRNREAREARQRRAEGRKVGARRNGSGGEDPGGGEGRERAVRFAS